MAKFKGPDLVKRYKKALDKAQAQLINKVQADLSASAPVDTGRLASSFFVGKNTPDRSEAPPRETPEAVTITKYSGEITFEGEWWISNNLPYAEYVALDPTNTIYGKNGRRNSSAWFTTIANNLQREADRIFQKELDKVK